MHVDARLMVHRRRCHVRALICRIAVAASFACVGGSAIAMTGEEIRRGIIESSQSRALPSSHIIKVNLSGTKLAIPIGYFDVRPLISNVKSGISGDWINFSFWMPSGRAPEIETFYHPGFQPKEPGLPLPGPNEHIVKVVQFRNHPLDKPGFISPERQHRNQVFRGPQNTGPEYAYFPHNDFIKFQATSGANTRWIYKHAEGSDIQFIIDCVDNVPIPGCDGWVYDTVTHVSFHLSFPRISLDITNSILKMTRQLFVSWKIK